MNITIIQTWNQMNVKTTLASMQEVYRKQLLNWLTSEKEEGHVTITELAKRLEISRPTLYAFLYTDAQIRLKTMSKIKEFLKYNYDPSHMDNDYEDGKKSLRNLTGGF